MTFFSTDFVCLPFSSARFSGGRFACMIRYGVAFSSIDVYVCSNGRLRIMWFRAATMSTPGTMRTIRSGSNACAKEVFESRLSDLLWLCFCGYASGIMFDLACKSDLPLEFMEIQQVWNPVFNRLALNLFGCVRLSSIVFEFLRI